MLLVFGRGVAPVEGRYALPPAGLERVWGAVAYVRAADRPPARVIFAGGWAAAAPAPPVGYREGDLMRAAARAAGLDRYTELYAETRSRTTLENLVHTVQDGLLAGCDLGPDRPLGLVTHEWHLPRVRFLAGRVLGLRGSALLDVPVVGAPGRHERLLRLAAPVWLLGAAAPDRMVRRERALRRFLP